MLDSVVEKRLVLDLILPKSEKEIEQYVKEVRQYRIYSIQVEEARADLVADLFRGRRVGMLVSFPLGNTSTKVKMKFAAAAIKKGCSQVLTAPNFNAFKSGDYTSVRRDLEAITKLTKDIVDLIVLVPTADMGSREVTTLCDLCIDAGIGIIKLNSTAKRGGGKSEYEHVQFLRRIYGHRIEIEASAGIRTREEARKFIEVGADRVHSSTWKQVLGLVD